MEYLGIETPLLGKNDISTGKMLACMLSVTEIQIRDSVRTTEEDVSVSLNFPAVRNP